MQYLLRSVRALGVAVAIASPWAPAIADGNPPIWQGAYTGIHIGGGWSRSATALSQSHAFESVPSSSPMGGMQAGYRLNNGRAIFGIEADVSASRIRGVTGGGGPGSGQELAVASNWLATLRGTFAIPIGTAQIYATAGLAMSDIDPRSVASERNRVEFGAVWGGGLEMWLGNGLSARIELLHYSFQDSVSLSQGANMAHGNTSTTVVRTGLNFALP